MPQITHECELPTDLLLDKVTEIVGFTLLERTQRTIGVVPERLNPDLIWLTQLRPSSLAAIPITTNTFSASKSKSKVEIALILTNC